MHYLAIGDSISIDYYTGVQDGGAASQLARRIQARPFHNRTRDGNVTTGVLADLQHVSETPQLITLTVGGNDLLIGGRADTILTNLERICGVIDRFGATVIISTVYDPTDGDDSLSSEIGLPVELRGRYNAVNNGIRELASRRGYLLADLEQLFHGHGIRADQTWYTRIIEPNLAGATAIAEHWYELLRAKGVLPAGTSAQG